jgi:hypothetical protein
LVKSAGVPWLFFAVFAVFAANYQPGSPMGRADPAERKRHENKNSKLVSVPVSAFIDLIGMP